MALIRLDSIVVTSFFAIAFLFCSTVVCGQLQPANFELWSTKTGQELTMGEREDTIQSWATWACALSMNIDSYESQWFNGSEEISRSGRTLIRDSPLFVDGRTPATAILIQNLSYSDQGAYDCQVRGTEPLTSWVSLTVTLTLVTNLTPVDPVVETYDDSLQVEIGCDMYGYIPPDETLYWMVDGEDIHSSTSGQKYSISYKDGVHKAQVGGNNPTLSRVTVLTIYDIELSDAKTYSCAIDGMNLMEDVTLIVNEAASPAGVPQNAQANVASSTSVLVSWEELPEDQRRGNITHYEVVFSQTAFQDILPAVRQTEGPVLSLLMENLEEFVGYSVSIRAFTSVGPGPFSPPVLVQTPEDGPTGAPTSLRVVPLDENKLDVSWSRPKDSLINGVLRMYIIHYCIVGGNQMMSGCGNINITGDTTQVVLENLMMDTMYNVSVAAYTVEIGPFASVVKVAGLATDDNLPPTETKTHKRGYSVIGIVVGIILAAIVIVTITGIVYFGVTYQCRKKQLLSEVVVGDEDGSGTISVSLSKDPELVLIPLGDGIALMRQLSAGQSLSSVGDEDGVNETEQEGEAIEGDSRSQLETVSVRISTPTRMSDRKVCHPYDNEHNDQERVANSRECIDVTIEQNL